MEREEEAATGEVVGAGARSPAHGVGSSRPEKSESAATPAAAGFRYGMSCASPPSVVGSSRPEKSESATPISLPSAAGFRSGLSCAKALFLLSSLKSRQIEKQMEIWMQEVERLKMLVEDLRGQLVRERLNCKQFRFFSMAETVLLISTMLSFLTFGFLLANY